MILVTALATAAAAAAAFAWAAEIRFVVETGVRKIYDGDRERCSSESFGTSED